MGDQRQANSTPRVFLVVAEIVAKEFDPSKMPTQPPTSPSVPPCAGMIGEARSKPSGTS